ncbi:MAG: hypothetical protein DSY82_07770 [Flavobacteriia bacterium]|nr:MAG: hypothetical protein DSY82_07770 [Flavobacteriia bacterium]
MKNYLIIGLLTFIMMSFTSQLSAQEKKISENNQKINRSIKRVKPILTSDRFINGTYNDVNACLEDIENILKEEGIGSNLANTMLGAIFGVGIKEQGSEKHDKPGIDDIGGIGGGADPMAGKFGQDALNGWNDMCSQLSYLQHSGNGDIVGRDKHMGMGAADCQKLKESWGFNGSDYYNSTATNSVVGSSHKLKEGEQLGNNSDGETDSVDSDDTSAAEDTDDSGDTYDANASYDDGNGNEKNSSNVDDQDEDDDQKNSSNEDDEKNSSSEDNNKTNYTGKDGGGGGSEDPAENDMNSGPISAEAQKQAQKLLGNKKQIGVVPGQAGGSNDGRGGEKDDEGNGKMIYTGGTMGSPDDERLQNNSSRPAFGKLKMTKKEQLGGNVRIKEK